MGGTATIALTGGSEELLTELFTLADRCESLWSRFSERSDLTVLNWAEGVATTVDPLTIRLIRAMREGYLITGGDFDPTLLPALLAVGYSASILDGSRRSTLPATAHSPGNLNTSKIIGNVVTLGRGTTLDAGGLGKGLVADIICEAAIAGGARGAMAEISGDIVVLGEAPHDTAWHLSIEDPFDTAQNLDRVRLIDAAIVTSSQLKRRWQSGSAQWHHLIDPRTNTSAKTRVQTATVIAATGAHAEALTKPAFMREPHIYLEWLPTVGGAGLLVLDDRSIHVSDNWGQYR